MKKLPTVLIGTTLGLAVGACGGSSTHAARHPAAPPAVTPTGVTRTIPAPPAGPGPAALTTSGVTVASAERPPYGQVLVNANGQSLYIFARGKQGAVACTAACQVLHPPLRPHAGAKLGTAGDAKGSLLGSEPNPAGGEVVTYDHRPLFTYLTRTSYGYSDTPGSTLGQALESNGGRWYLISPAGAVITKKGALPPGVLYPPGQ
jgi:predicted lipoprotein with Yx(FWY)xxD motif